METPNDPESVGPLDSLDAIRRFAIRLPTMAELFPELFSEKP